MKHRDLSWDDRFEKKGLSELSVKAYQCRRDYLPKDVWELRDIAGEYAHKVGEDYKGESGFFSAKARAVASGIENLKSQKRDRELSLNYNNVTPEELSGNLPPDSTPMLIFIIPGLQQTAGPWLPMAKRIYDSGNLSYIEEYDSKEPFEDYVRRISETLGNIWRSSLTRLPTIGLGHSTGADILRWGSVKGYFPEIDGLVLSAGVTNGSIPKTLVKIMYGQQVQYCDPRTDKGERIIMEMNEPFEIPHITIAGNRDYLVPKEDCIDTSGLNWFHKLGHVAGSGVYGPMNELYMFAIYHIKSEILEKHPEPKSL